MITETLLSVVMGLIGWIVSIVPDFGLNLDLDIAAAFQQIGGLAYTLNGWFPVTALIACLVILIGTQAGLTVWGFIVWLYHQFWGSD